MAGVTTLTPKISENDMKKFEIIDNAISVAYQTWIEDYMTSSVFPWFYNKSITYSGKNDPRGVDPYSGFFHLMLGPENHGPTNSSIDSLLPIVLGVLGDQQIKELLRVRAGMFIKNQTGAETKHHKPHIDRPGDDKPYKTLIYYVMDSDGTTGIYEDSKLVEEVEPKRGRVLLMDGDVFHASQCPKKHNQRIVVNYNFRI